MLFKDQSMKMKRTQNLPLMNKPTLFKGLLLVACFFLSSLAYSQTVSVEVLNAAASETGAAPGSFRIIIAPSSPSFLFINYTVSGTATPGNDYSAISGSILVNPGDTEVIVPLTGIQDDNLVEGPESVTLTIDPDLFYIVGLPNSATINITDNDIGTISLDLTAPPFDDSSFEEGLDPGNFRIVLDNPNGTQNPVTVNYTLSGSAANGTDFSLAGAVVMTFAENGTQVARNLNINPIQDLVFEPNETIILTLNSTDNPALFSIGAPNTATVTLFDNDCPSGTVAPILNGNPTSFCDVAGVNLNTFVNGSAPPQSALRWSTTQNPTTIGQLLSVAASNTAPAGTYYAVYWSDIGACASPSSGALNISISQTPNIGTASNTASCNTTAFGGITTLDLDTTLNGSDLGGTWAYVSGPANPGAINGQNVINFNNDPSGNYVFSYTLTSGTCPPQSLQVTISVNNCDPCTAGNTAPVLNSTTPTNFCDVIDVGLNDYTTSNTANIRWSTNSDTSVESSHLTPTAVNNPPGSGTYYGFFWDDVNNCASPSLTRTITLSTTPTITNSNGDTRCGPGVVNLSATASNGQVRWYTTLTGGTAVNNLSNYSPNITQTTTYYLEAFANTCTSSPRVAVVATVNPAVSAGIANNTSSCSNATYGTTTVDLDNQLTGASAGVWVFTSGPQNMALDAQNVVNFVGVPDGNYVFTFTTTGAQAPCTDESASVTISVSNCDTDNDGDGLFGGTEQALGTDPNNADTDGDGINDGVEVGPDINNPLDQDNDGIIDALESIILDEDNDGVVDQLDPNNSNPCVPNVTSGLCPVDLEIKKDVDSPNTSVGSTVTFTVTVTNVSDTPLQSAQIGELLETGFEYVSHVAAEGSSYDPQTSVWDIAELEPNANTTLEITVLVLEDGVYSNTAELLASSPADANGTNDSATVNVSLGYPPGYDLLLEKSAVSVSPLVGDEVTFTIRVTNQSTESAPITNIVVEDIIQDNDSLPKFIYNSHTSDVGTYIVETGRWTIPSLAQYSVATLTIKVLVPREGIFVNTARILADDDNVENNEDFVTIKVSTATKVDVGILYNQFSPNGDETNEVLKINRTDFDSDERPLVPLVYSIQIFNRYGALVFEGNDSFDDVDQREAEVWDGTWKNEDAPAGTYFYVLEFDLNNGQGPQISKGWIQLIR